MDLCLSGLCPHHGEGALDLPQILSCSVLTGAWQAFQELSPFDPLTTLQWPLRGLGPGRALVETHSRAPRY